MAAKEDLIKIIKLAEELADELRAIAEVYPWDAWATEAALKFDSIADDVRKELKKAIGKEG